LCILAKEQEAPDNFALCMCYLTRGNSFGYPYKSLTSVLERYQLNNSPRLLGSGEISQVFLGCDSLNGNRPVAIKKIDKNRLKSNIKMQQRLEQEIQVLQRIASIESDLFVKFYESFEDESHVYIVTEFVEGGELYELVEKFPFGVPELLSKSILKQIFTGVALLHKNNIVHLDLKLENIMYNPENDKIKIIDFGFAMATADKQRLTEYCGSLHYIAPQLLYKIPYDGFKADVWSLGVLSFALLSSKFPFDDEMDNHQKIFWKIKKGAFEAPAHFSASALSFVQSILEPNENNRPDCSSLLTHPFLR